MMNLKYNKKHTFFLWLFLSVLGSFPVNAQPIFEDVSVAAGIDHFSSFTLFEYAMSGGVAWADLNNDNWDDLYLTGGREPDKLYINNQDGTFTDISVISGIAQVTAGSVTNGVAAADINRDGLSDLIVTTNHESRNLLFINQGDGTFNEMGVLYNLTDVAFSTGVSVGDYNQDGWPDLHIVNWRIINQFGAQLDESYPNRLYMNTGNSSFIDVTMAQNLYSTASNGLASSFTDYDLDGDADLLVANDFGYEPWTTPNQLFQNNSGSFSDVSVSVGFNLEMNAMGIATGDYDEDLDFDYYITDVGTNALMRNDEGLFIDQAEDLGIDNQWPHPDSTSGEESWGWGTVFFDFDNDSYLDIISANGYVNAARPAEDLTRIFRNDQTYNFEDVTFQSGLADGRINRGCAVSDYDKDGDLDVFLTTLDTLDGSGRSGLYVNTIGNSQNWLAVDLEAVISNLDAIGTVVIVHFQGRSLMREVDSGGGSYNSHNSKQLFFGLNDATVVDSVEVSWPSGIEETIYSVSVNQAITLIETVPVGSGGSVVPLDAINLYPNPSNGLLRLSAIQKISEINVYNLTGELVHSQTDYGDQLNLTHLRPGIYLLQCMLGSDIYRSKISIK